MNSRRTTRKMVSLLLSLLLAVLLAVIMVTVSLLAGFCKKAVYLKHMSDEHYYQAVYEGLQEDLNTWLTEMSIPVFAGAGVFESSQVYVDGRVYVTAVLEGKEAEIDTARVEERLAANLEAWMEEQRMDAEELQSGVKAIIDQTAQNYRKMLSFHYADFFYAYRQEILSAAVVILPLCTAAAAAAVILLLKLNRRKHRAVRYMVYALTAATAANTLYTVYLQRLVSQEVPARNSSLYAEMVQGYLTESAGQGYYVSILGAVLTAALLLVIQIRKKKSRRGDV